MKRISYWTEKLQTSYACFELADVLVILSTEYETRQPSGASFGYFVSPVLLFIFLGLFYPHCMVVRRVLEPIWVAHGWRQGKPLEFPQSHGLIWAFGWFWCKLVLNEESIGNLCLVISFSSCLVHIVVCCSCGFTVVLMDRMALWRKQSSFSHPLRGVDLHTELCFHAFTPRY